MKVHRNKLDEELICALGAQIDAACTPGIEGRVCGAHCKIVCNSCGSMKCQCMCAHDCKNLPRMLSSSPDDLPIEMDIAPLVFELRRTGFYTPCWSCEGHLGCDDKLWKLPQVWFTCESAVHLRLLADMLQTMEFRQQVRVPWAVMITHSDAGNPETTYTLRPHQGVRDCVGPPVLTSLQADVVAIAHALSSGLAERARSLKFEMAYSGVI